MNFAYDKINLEAFENSIQLNGDNYTIFIEQNEEEEPLWQMYLLCPEQMEKAEDYI